MRKYWARKKNGGASGPAKVRRTYRRKDQAGAPSPSFRVLIDALKAQRDKIDKAIEVLEGLGEV